MREGNRDVGEVWEVRKKKKENSRDTPDQCKGADGGSAVKTPEAASASEKWIDCARNGVSG